VWNKREKNSVVKSPNNCEFKRGNNNNIDNIEIKNIEYNEGEKTMVREKV
jgi:hypothetical protein